MGKRLFVAIAFALLVPAAEAAGIFDFSTTARTLISTTDGPPPGTGSFAAVPGFTTTLFEVGNLFNGCGLFPGNASRGGTGTGCALTDHNTSNPGSFLSGSLTYTDTFFLAEPTQGSLQIIVKLGHPEAGGARNQNQTEQFDVFLESGTTRVLLAELLDNVSSPSLEDDAYYRYVYAAAVIPAGTWHPVFVARDGSIEFLTRLSAQGASVPVPGSLWLLAAALAALALTRRPAGVSGRRPGRRRSDRR